MEYLTKKRVKEISGSMPRIVKKYRYQENGDNRRAAIAVANGTVSIFYSEEGRWELLRTVTGGNALKIIFEWFPSYTAMRMWIDCNSIMSDAAR